MKKTLLLILSLIILLALSYFLFFNKDFFINNNYFVKDNLIFNNESKEKLKYNEILAHELEPTEYQSYFKTEQEGKIVEWKGKISRYYTQITGIKFCVIDEDHENVNTEEPCDFFWAYSEDLMDADNISVNPNWDGNWVRFILDYYNLPLDEEGGYLNDTYLIKGVVLGVDCAPSDRCSPDIDIINIRKDD